MGGRWGRGVCHLDPTPRRYDSPGAATNPSHAVAALRLGSQAQAPHRIGAVALRLAPDRRALRDRRAGGEIEDPGQHRPVSRRRAWAGARRPHGEPMARPRRQRRHPAPGRVAERDRLRRHRPLEPALRTRAGRLGRARHRALRPDPPRGPLLPRPGALPLPAAAAGRHPARGAPLLQPHQRGPAVGARRGAGVPTYRVLQDPAVHLLRLVLRRQQGAALHPDGPAREPARPRPAPAAPPARGLGRGHGGDRPGGGRRLRRAALRPLHRHAVDHDRAVRLPRARCGPVRRRAPTSPPATSARCTPGSRSGSIRGRRRTNVNAGGAQLRSAGTASAQGASGAPGSASTSRPGRSRSSPPT